MYRIHTFRDAEIPHLVITEFVHEQICRLYIPVYDTLFLAVHQCSTDIPAHFTYLPDGKSVMMTIPT